MQLNPEQTRIIASILCDYAQIESCLAPDELDVVINVAREAGFPQNSIEALARMRANAIALLEGGVHEEGEHWIELRATR